MNCKPGDLAIYVGMHPEHHGKVVRVVKLAELTRNQVARRVCDTYWVIEPKLGTKSKCADTSLRPIRPGDISDEEVRDLYAPKITEAA